MKTANQEHKIENKIIYLGGDHASYEAREKLQKHLNQIGFQVFDEGSYDDQPANYAYYALKVAKKVQKNHNSLGIVICGSGIGVNIAANKVKGIKSALVYSKKTASFAAKHNFNVLALGSRFLIYKHLETYVDIFLNVNEDDKPTDVSYQYLDIQNDSKTKK